MPADITEFEQETAFERYTLDRITPMLPQTGTASVLDLGEAGTPPGVTVTPQPAMAHAMVFATDSTGGSADCIKVDDIRPLLFGAAWKVLDLLVETQLHQAGVKTDTKYGTYNISTKAKAARAGTVNPPSPFDSHPDLWDRLCGIYSTTDELRNSLTHRGVSVDPTTGNMTEVLPPGFSHTPQSLTAQEQAAFCSFTIGAAKAVITGSARQRQTDQLRWLLDQLTAKHGKSPFGAAPATGFIPTVVIRSTPTSGGMLSIDFSDVRQRAANVMQGVSHFDLKIHLPDLRVLACPLEDAPAGTETFSIHHLPGWLTEE
jgi:hypothetical protein